MLQLLSNRSSKFPTRRQRGRLAGFPSTSLTGLQRDGPPPPPGASSTPRLRPCCPAQREGPECSFFLCEKQMRGIRRAPPTLSSSPGCESQGGAPRGRACWLSGTDRGSAPRPREPPAPRSVGSGGGVACQALNLHTQHHKRHSSWMLTTIFYVTN